MKSQVSLKDVARVAGVSFQTASKALNNKGSVASETRERIRAAAAELGYVPNALARGLVNRNTSLIGVVASDMTQSILTLPVAGVEREAQRLGFNVIIGSVNREGTNSDAVIQTLLERRVDGIIMMAPLIEDLIPPKTLSGRALPVVTTHDFRLSDAPRILVDEEKIGRDATGHLISLGHSRIATIVGDSRRHVSQRRLNGYRSALKGAGIELNPNLIAHGNWDIEQAYQCTHQLMDSITPPTAIFVHNDTMAMGALAALHDRGIRVPEDCSVIGCDNQSVSSHTIPPLTTFEIPFQRMGELAMQRLNDLISGATDVEQRTQLHAPMVYRLSTSSLLRQEKTSRSMRETS